jgi:membrane-bound serine protease (ClpP class)
VAGTIGATCLPLALFGLSVLPVNAVGVLLWLLSAALFVGELVAPGTAGFAFGGAVVLVLAGLFLFDSSEGVSVGLGDDAVADCGHARAGSVGREARVPGSAPPVPVHGTGPAHRRLVSVSSVDAAALVTGGAYAEGAWWGVRSVGPPLGGRLLRVLDTLRPSGRA